MGDSYTRQDKREPVTLKIRFKSETIEQFIERYAMDVSRGGIFVRTKKPLAVGTALRFAFQLRNEQPLISGDGTVVWIREFDPNSKTPPGMGIRFDHLVPDCIPKLEQILKEKNARTARAEQAGEPIRKTRPTFKPFLQEQDDKDAAFQESTKVQSLADLVAKTIRPETKHGMPVPDGIDDASDPRNAPTATGNPPLTPEELAEASEEGMLVAATGDDVSDVLRSFASSAGDHRTDPSIAFSNTTHEQRTIAEPQSESLRKLMLQDQKPPEAVPPPAPASPDEREDSLDFDAPTTIADAASQDEFTLDDEDIVDDIDNDIDDDELTNVSLPLTDHAADQSIDLNAPETEQQGDELSVGEDSVKLEDLLQSVPQESFLPEPAGADAGQHTLPVTDTLIQEERNFADDKADTQLDDSDTKVPPAHDSAEKSDDQVASLAELGLDADGESNQANPAQTPPSSSSSRVGVLLLAIVLAACLGAGATIVFMKYWKTDETKQSQTAQTQSSAATSALGIASSSSAQSSLGSAAISSTSTTSQKSSATRTSSARATKSAGTAQHGTIPIDITVSPADATVRVSGVKTATGSTFVSLKKGKTYKIVVSRNGFAKKTLSFTAGQDALPNVSLQPLVYRLIVKSTPEDARVYYSGRELGRTPTTVNLGQGTSIPTSATITVSKTGYTTKKSRIRMWKGENVKASGVFKTVTLKLSPQKALPASSSSSSEIPPLEDPAAGKSSKSATASTSNSSSDKAKSSSSAAPAPTIEPENAP